MTEKPGHKKFVYHFRFKDNSATLLKLTFIASENDHRNSRRTGQS